MNRCALLALLIQLSACTRPLIARVDAVSDPAVSIEVYRTSKLCFLPPDPEKDLPERVEYGALTDVCGQVATLKGYTVVDPKTETCDFILGFGWHEGDGKTYHAGSSTYCSPGVGGSVYCSTYNRSATFYGKSIRISVYDPKQEYKEAHRVSAAMVTGDYGVNESTVIALCRAAFQEFPIDRDGVDYETGFDLPEAH